MRRAKAWVPVLVAVCLFAGFAWSARNSSGTYSLPAGNPVVTGTVISSTWANGTLSDIATELTNSVDRNGRGAMLAAFQAYAGTAAVPGIEWSAEPGTGFYRGGANDISISDQGTVWAELNPVRPTQLAVPYGALTVSPLTLPGTFPNGFGTPTASVASLYGIVGVGGSAGSATIDGGIGVFGIGGPGFGSGNSAGGTGVKGQGGYPGGNGVVGCGTPLGTECSEGIQFAQGIGVTGAGNGAVGGGTITGSATPNIGVYGLGGTAGTAAQGLAGQAAGGLFIAGGANGLGVVAQGGSATQPGNALYNATAATASTRSNALELVNGDLLMGGTQPNGSVGPANTLTKKNIPKAWINYTTNSSASPTVNDSFNVASVTATVGTGVTVNFTTAMGNALGGAVCAVSCGGGGVGSYIIANCSCATNGSECVINMFGANSGVAPSFINPAGVNDGPCMAAFYGAQ